MNSKKVRIDKSQITLLGRPQGEEELKAMQQRLLNETPNPLVKCPFCLGEQRLHFMRLFLGDGSLSKKVRCVYCHREMTLESTLITNRPNDFGMWAAEYPGFWKVVDHDTFVLRLKQLGIATEFWEGYKKVRPNVGKSKEEVENETAEQKWKEYQETEQAYKNYKSIERD